MERAPTWADGCDQCRYGLVNPPPLTRAVDLYMERMAQALVLGSRIFCNCRAGQGYRAYLLRQRRKLIKESEAMAAKHTVMQVYWQQYADRHTHPDIERAIDAVVKALPPEPLPKQGELDADPSQGSETENPA